MKKRDSTWLWIVILISVGVFCLMTSIFIYEQHTNPKVVESTVSYRNLVNITVPIFQKEYEHCNINIRIRSIRRYTHITPHL